MDLSSAARFITQDYKTRETGCVTEMQRKLDLPPLQDRRKQLRLVLMYKIVEGLVPGLPVDDFLTKDKPGRQIRPKRFSDCVDSNPITRFSKQHSRCYKVVAAKTEQVKNSYFHRTVVEWNNLDSETVNSQCVASFQRRLRQD